VGQVAELGSLGLTSFVDFRAYFERLWMGRVTAPENIRWFIPIWAWSGLIVLEKFQNWPSQILSVTFFFVFLASMVPFVCRRIGLVRWWLFGWVLPVIAAVIVVQCLRSFLHSA